MKLSRDVRQNRIQGAGAGVTAPRIKPCIRRLLSAFLLIGALAGLLPAAHAQTEDDSRTEYAAYSPDGALVVHVSVPRGQTIEEAEITLGDSTLPLDPEPVQLPTVQWFILDSSGEMINAAGGVRSAVERFILGAQDTRIGVIIYGAEVRVLQPTAQLSQVSSFLDTYTATPNAPGCIGDALAAFNALDRPADEATRVLLVAGPLSRQGSCLEDPVQDIGAPIDAIIIADDLDEAYLDLTEGSAGQLRRANLVTIDARFTEVRTLWALPVYALHGQAGAYAERGTLSLRLSNNRTLTLAAEIRQLEGEAIAAQPNSGQPTPTTVGLQAVATSTLPPTSTPAPTDTPAASEPPTLEPTAPQSAPTEATPAEGENTQVAVIPATEVSAPEATESQAAETTVPEASPTPEPTATATPTPTPAPAAGGTSEGEGESESSLSPLVLVGGGLVGLAVVILLGFAFAAARQPRRNPTLVFEQQMFEQTQIIPPDADPYNLYESGAAAVQGDATFIMPAYNRAEEEEEEAEELMLTQLQTDEDFQHLQQESRREVVAWLRHDTAPPQDYEITAAGVTVGRSPKADIVIWDDVKVSGEHVRIEPHLDGSIWLTVISQRNPARVSGVILQPGQKHQLRSQNVIQLSPSTRLLFILRDEEDDDFDEGVTQL